MSRPSLVIAVVALLVCTLIVAGCGKGKTEGAAMAPSSNVSVAASTPEAAGPDTPPVAPSSSGTEVAASADTSSASASNTQAGDNVPPTIVAPPDIRTGGGRPEGREVDLGTPQVRDNADPNPRVANDAPQLLPPGRTVVTWTATDASGNRATAQQVVVIDTNRPKGGGEAH